MGNHSERKKYTGKRRKYPPPRFTIYGNSEGDAFLYTGLGLSFIVLFIYMLIEHTIDWNLTNILAISGIACLIGICAYLSFYAAKVSRIYKCLTFDGLNLYVYYGNKLKNRVNFKTVKEIGSTAYSYRGFPIYYVYIKYVYKGKRKTLGFYEDDYTKKGLKNIFWNLVKCGKYYHVKIKDYNYWMKDILEGKRKL
jgi:hypothetical protein